MTDKGQAMIKHGTGKNHYEAKTRFLPKMFASPEEGLLLFHSKHFVTKYHKQESSSPVHKNTKTKLQKFCKVESVAAHTCTIHLPGVHCTACQHRWWMMLDIQVHF